MNNLALLTDETTGHITVDGTIAILALVVFAVAVTVCMILSND